jgi:ppGpp synthetase/RelA/SpoT-type nucleotidyltranferase
VPPTREGRAVFSIENIYDDIVDLAGVRVALYFPGDRELVGNVIQREFDLLRPPKVFPEQDREARGKRFAGYVATHYHVQFQDAKLAATDKRYADARVEIQVASVLMHAWSEVEHDLVYKPLNGELSEDEYATLEELNGLVLTGEIALERLQRAGERRVTEQERKFANHYDLAAYLLIQPLAASDRQLKDSDLGRVDLLFSFLYQCSIDPPAALETYLEFLDADFEQRPVGDQIIDRVLAEDPTRYEIYEGVRARAHEPVTIRHIDSPYDQAVGRFIRTWMTFETLVRNVAIGGGERITSVPSARLLSKLGILDDQRRSEVERIRRLRNNLVHGIEIPQTLDLIEATSELETLVVEVQLELGIT